MDIFNDVMHAVLAGGIVTMIAILARNRRDS